MTLKLMAGKEAVVGVHTEIDRGSVSCETAYDILLIDACTVILAPLNRIEVYISAIFGMALDEWDFL